jgi:hypothetical protein
MMWIVVRVAWYGEESMVIFYMFWLLSPRTSDAGARRDPVYISLRLSSVNPFHDYIVQRIDPMRREEVEELLAIGFVQW